MRVGLSTSPTAVRNRRYRDKKRGGPVMRRLGFWDRVDKSGDCWLWVGHRNRQGYGHHWHDGKHWRAHRLAWTLTNGPVPDGLVVMHSCDNPSCCRPEHLSLGTLKDNASDREHKGRGNHYEGHSRTKLTVAAVEEIRRIYRYGSSDFGAPALARRYGIHVSRIYSIVKGVAWCDV